MFCSTPIPPKNFWLVRSLNIRVAILAFFLALGVLFYRYIWPVFHQYLMGIWSIYDRYLISSMSYMLSFEIFQSTKSFFDFFKALIFLDTNLLITLLIWILYPLYIHAHKKIKIAISLKTLIRIKCRSQQLSVLEKCKALSWFRFVCKLWTRCRLDLLTFRLLPRSNNNCYLYVGIDLWLVRVCLQEVESK